MTDESTENEKKEDPNFGKKLGREVTIAAATTLAGLGTLYAASALSSRVQNFRARRAAKKVDAPENETV